MCADFIICKVGATITGANNHDGTYTVRIKESKPRRQENVLVLSKDEVKSRYGEYVSLDTFEKRETKTPEKVASDSFETISTEPAEEDAVSDSFLKRNIMVFA